MQFSNGATFAPKQLVLSKLGFNDGWTSFNSFPRCLGNVKSLTGGADIIGFGSGGVYLSSFNGATGNFGAPVLVVSGQYSAGSGYSFDSTPILCGDMDGDGRTDIVALGTASNVVAYGQSDGSFGNAETTTQMVSGFSSFDTNPR